MRLALIFAVVCIAAGCGSENPGTSRTDEAEIDALYADYRVAVENADISAYVGALHPAVRLLPPGADAIVGANRYAGFLRPVFEAATYRIDVVTMPVIEVFGDVAVAEYEYVIHLDLKDPEVGVAEPGALTASRTRSRYFDVLRKREDGKWGIWRHTWTTLEE